MTAARVWRLLDALGSRPLSVGLMAALLLYLVMLFGFTLTSPEPVVGAIGRGIPFLTAYALIALNTLACVAVFWRTVRARCRPWHLRSSSAKDAGAPAPRHPGARRWLRWRGFSISTAPGGALHAGRGRFSALGSPVFHLAIVLAAGGAVLEHHGGFSGTALLSEGQAFYGEPREYLRLDPATAPLAPQLSFKVRRVHPEYFGDELFFTELVAEVETPVGPDAQVREVRLSDSVAMGEGHVTLTGYGYSLEYALLGPDAAVRDEGLAALMIFPPGQKDSVRLPDLPYTVFAELFPDFVVDANGTPGTKGMALGDVRLGLTVLRNRVVLAKRIVKPGEGVTFDGLTFVPRRLVPQGQFRVRRSPGVPVLGAAFVLMLLGLTLRLVWTRREVLVSPDGEVRFEGDWASTARADFEATLREAGGAA